MSCLESSHPSDMGIVPCAPSRMPTSPELTAALDPSTSPKFYNKSLEDDSVMRLQHLKQDHQKLEETDARSKALRDIRERLQKKINRLKEDIMQEFANQRKFDVLDRFCRGLTGILQENIRDLKDLLFILSVELESPTLAYAPIGFVFVTYYLYHEHNALPEFFCQFPPHLHLKNVATLEYVPPTSELTLRTLSSIMNGPYGDSVQLLIHLWVIRADLARKQNVIACRVPNLTFASETLHALIHDPDQQALVEQILPSLVDEEGINYQIEYFLPS